MWSGSTVTRLGNSPLASGTFPRFHKKLRRLRRNLPMAKITVHGGPTNATLDELEKEVEELEAEEYDEDLEDQAADEEELEDAEETDGENDDETGEQTLTLPKKVVRKSTAKKK